MVEHLIRFIDSNNTFLFWRIYDSKGNELFEYEDEDIETIKDSVLGDYPFLQTGQYILRGATSKYQGEKSSKKLPFTISPEPKQTALKPSPNSMNTFSVEQVEKMVIAAEQRGREKARIDILESKVSEFIERYEREQKALKEVISKKFDELDGNNDSDFVGKATEAISKIAPQMPAISESLKGFKF